MEDQEYEPPEANPDQLPFEELEIELHPSPEIAFLRLAIDKVLMRDQKELWYMYAYDKLLPAEIARKLKVNKSTITRRIKTIERQLQAFCKSHMEAYKAILEAQNDSEGC